MRKRILAALLGLAILSSAGQAFAGDVLVTKNGTKYHTELCNLVKNKDEAQVLDEKEAAKQGYEPCKRCLKGKSAGSDESGK